MKKKILTIGAGLAALSVPSLTLAADDLKNTLTNMLTTVGQTAKYDTSGVNFWDVVGKYMGGALFSVGIIFMIQTIYGGYQWMTAGGNSQQVSDAQARIRNGIIGVVVIFLAYTLTDVVLDYTCQITGALCGEQP